MSKMSKISNIIKNKWFILGISILNASYTIVLCYFAYATFLYDIEYTNKVKFSILYVLFSLITGSLMFFTRKSPFTAVFAMLNLIALFPTVLLDWGNWPLIIPAAIVVLFGFFSCKMNDTLKTIFGTIFLLMYILGSVAFFLIMNVFRVTTIDTLIDFGTSPSGDFRYYVVDMQNNSTGKTAVYVQPNALDVETSFIKLDTTIKRLVKQANNPTTVNCKWNGAKLYINGEEYFNEEHFVKADGENRLYDFSEGNWTYTFFEIRYPLFELINSMTEVISEKFEKSDDNLEQKSTGS